MTDRKEDNMNQEREQTKPRSGLTRREFLKKAGVAIAGAVASLIPARTHI